MRVQSEQARAEMAPAVPLAERQPVYSREMFPEDVTVVLVCDKEDDNLIGLVDEANYANGMIRPIGVIIPGGDLDSRIVQDVDRLRSMDGESLGIPRYTVIEGVYHEWYDMDFYCAKDWKGSIYDYADGKGLDFLKPPSFKLRHVPYVAAKLKTEPNYRETLGDDYAAAVIEINPTHVILANFKVILPASFIEKLAKNDIKVLNLHPSVLPEAKGWRPEIKIYKEGLNPRAFGWTLHEVIPEIDGGATVAKQTVAFPAENLRLKATLNEKDYEDYREEQLRSAIIRDQARWSARIMAIYGSNVARKTLYGREAFAAEGREEFFDSQEYADILADERKKNDSEEPKPYARVVFDMEASGDYQIIEDILGMNKVSTVENVHTLTQYQVRFPHVSGQRNGAADERFMALVEEAIALGGHRRNMIWQDTANDPNGEAIGIIEANCDLAKLITALGGTYETVELPTRVTVPRQALGDPEM